MSSITQVVNLVEDKLKVLLEKYIFLKEENEFLFNKIALLEDELAEGKRLFNDIEKKHQTLKIAKKFDVKIVMCKGKLLEARIVGTKKSKGEYVLFLDSDQILEKTSIERAVKKMKEIVPEFISNNSKYQLLD